MSNDNILTFHGRVGTKVELRDVSTSPWVMFRAASTPSYWDQAARVWRDLETTWVSIKAQRTLALNAAESLQIGDPILAVGKLRTHTWKNKDGQSRESTVLEATALSHDLSRGITTFRRVDRQPTSVPSDHTAQALADLEGQSEQSPAA